MEHYLKVIEEDNLEAFKEILDQLIKDSDKLDTVLESACRLNRTEMVRHLLSHPLVKFSGEGALKPLPVAFQEGCLEIVQLLLERTDIDVNCDMGYNGATPLYTACQKGHLEIVLLLLEREDIDVNGNGYKCPLREACLYGYLEIVKVLLEREDIDVNKGTSTPLYDACLNGHLEIVQLLLKQPRLDVNGGVFNSLSTACRKGHSEIAKLLLQREDIDVNGDQFYYPLEGACSNGLLEIVELLLEREDIDVNSNKCECPLQGASKNGHSEIVKLLLKQPRIDVNKGINNTPLCAACENGHLEIVRLLLSNGATIDDKTRERALLKGISLDQTLTVPFPSAPALSSTNGEALALDKSHPIERQTLGPLAPILKKCEWDLLDGSTDWYVFKPLMRVSKNVFTQNTISNDKFMHWINSTASNSMERGVMKHLVQCFLYGDEWPTPTHWSEWLALLFIIDSSSMEWPRLTVLCVGSLIKLVDMKMAATLIKSIHKYQQLAELLLVRVEESLLSNLEHYAFSYIAIQCREESMQTIYREVILSDPYFEPYYKLMNHLNRLGTISIETPPSEVTHLGWALLFNREDGDLELADRSIKCHRTILCTVSANFETYFNDWKKQKAVKSPVMIHIVRYCYGVGGEIAASDLVPLMLLSHDLAMNDLFELAQSQVIISTDNFFTLLQQLDNYTGELSMEPLIERLIKFGIDHANDLFIPRNIPLLRGSIIDLIRLRK